MNAGQGRIGADPWDRPDLYVENSPTVLSSDACARRTYAIQGRSRRLRSVRAKASSSSARCRRAGKEATCSRSSAENHGLAKQPNKDYWTVHLDEFFDHFLLGTPKPDWMTHNGSYEHRGERDVDALFTPATVFDADPARALLASSFGVSVGVAAQAVPVAPLAPRPLRTRTRRCCFADTGRTALRRGRYRPVMNPTSRSRCVEINNPVRDQHHFRLRPRAVRRRMVRSSRTCSACSESRISMRPHAAGDTAVKILSRTDRLPGGTRFCDGTLPAGKIPTCASARQSSKSRTACGVAGSTIGKYVSRPSDVHDGDVATTGLCKIFSAMKTSKEM